MRRRLTMVGLTYLVYWVVIVSSILGWAVVDRHEVRLDGDWVVTVLLVPALIPAIAARGGLHSGETLGPLGWGALIVGLAWAGLGWWALLSSGRWLVQVITGALSRRT